MRATPLAAAESAPPRRVFARPFLLLTLAWAGLAPVLGVAIGATGSLHGRDWTTEATFFWAQDLPVILGCIALTAALGVAAPALRPLAAAFDRPAAIWVAALAAVCLVAGVLGGWLAFGGYTLSLDEFLANFDARIFASGRLFAAVPAAWRPYAAALQPVYMLDLPSGLWASSYLPVNAALRALAGLAGVQWLLNPALGAFSVVAVWRIGRRLWPDEPRAAVLAAALLGASAQLIVMSMTAYAMSAHLAFNLAWLWLFLRGGRLGHAGAIAVGFLATGLHQLIFHPIFVAPFILQLWIERRWRAAALYTLAYAAICGFWVAWWPLVTHAAGVAQPSDDSAVDLDWISDRVSDAFDALKIGSIGVYAQSVARFAAWQNPLLAPLLVAAAIPAFLAKGALRALILGVFLTFVAVGVASPTQTHGWGWRYMHGLLGSTAQIGGWAFARWTGRLDRRAREAALGAFVAACAVSLFVLVPLRIWQAASYVAPYAAADAAIRRDPAEVVVVDHNGETTLFDMGTLVRNDPFLARSPKVMALSMLPAPLVAELCRTHSVALFNHVSAESFGIDVVPWRGPRGLMARRAVMAKLGCGRLILAPTRGR